MSSPEITLWSEFFELMKWRHIAHGHDLVDTINRLMAKHPSVVDSGRMVQLPRDKVTISAELWDLSRLWPLIHPKQITPDEPFALSGPVAVLRWDGCHYLVDGRRRINHWQRQGVTGPHRVLLIKKRGDDI
jgi:hypothetical protein